MTPDLSAYHTEDGELVQDHEQHIVSTSQHPVTLLATSNGTHIAVQVWKSYHTKQTLSSHSEIQMGGVADFKSYIYISCE